jgi:hypothetical protein
MKNSKEDNKARENHPCFKGPNNENIKIWRYISLPKFMRLVQSKSLYFSRANYLGDPFEGSLSQANIQFREYVRKFRHIVPQLESYRDIDDQTLDRLFRTQSESHKYMVDRMLVSCWHMSDYESAAMWKLYSSGEPIVAIQSTYKILETLLPVWANLGTVQYADYQKDLIPEINAFYPIMHKQNSFEHEKELRAVIWDMNTTDTGGKFISANADSFGLNLPIDIHKLMQNIFIDPLAPHWFENVVRDVCEIYQLNVTICKSNLASKALY